MIDLDSLITPKKLGIVHFKKADFLLRIVLLDTLKNDAEFHSE